MQRFRKIRQVIFKCTAILLTVTLISIGSAGFGYLNAKNIFANNKNIISQSLTIKDIWFAKRWQYGMLHNWTDIDKMQKDDKGSAVISKDGLSFILSLQINNGDQYLVEFVVKNSANKNITAKLTDTKIDIKIIYANFYYHNNTIGKIKDGEWLFTVPAKNVQIIDMFIDVGSTITPDFYQIEVKIEPTKLNNVIIAHNLEVSYGDVDGDGILNWVELDDSDGHTTDPLDADTDDDGLPDGWIDYNRNRKQDIGEYEDKNCDGRVDYYESDPLKGDSDGDGLKDGKEAGITISKATFDTWIASPNFEEDEDGGDTITFPWDDDSDDDALPDGWIDFNGNGIKDFGEYEDYNLDGKIEGDENHNGFREIWEEWTETNPFDDDSDRDGLNDGLEIGLSYSQCKRTSSTWQCDRDPTTTTLVLDADSDNDGLPDGWIDYNGNENKDLGEYEDRNLNGRREANEPDPNNGDTDEDNLKDGMEAGITIARATRDTDKSSENFVEDADPTTTTIPWKKDTDEGGLDDDLEDINRNGAVDFGELDPNSHCIADAGGPYIWFEGLPLTFDATSSYHSSGYNLKYKWDWTNDGIYDTAFFTNPIATHTYTDDFFGSVKLLVDDGDEIFEMVIDGEDDDTDVTSITILNLPPLANAGGPYIGREGSSITFIGSATDPGDDTFEYRWDFDNDGIYDSPWSSSPTATYLWNDDFSGIVTLQVRDDDGGIDTDIASVVVMNIAPIADVNGPYFGYNGTPITFFGDAIDTPMDTLTFEWDFDYDGITFTIDDSGIDLKNPEHIYIEEGVYVVALRIIDDDFGISEISTSTVTIS